jgi:hypothetical protein
MFKINLNLKEHQIFNWLNRPIVKNVAFFNSFLVFNSHFLCFRSFSKKRVNLNSHKANKDIASYIAEFGTVLDLTENMGKKAKKAVVLPTETVSADKKAKKAVVLPTETVSADKKAKKADKKIKKTADKKPKKAVSTDTVVLSADKKPKKKQIKQVSEKAVVNHSDFSQTSSTAKVKKQNSNNKKTSSTAKVKKQNSNNKKTSTDSKVLAPSIPSTVLAPSTVLGPSTTSTSSEKNSELSVEQRPKASKKSQKKEKITKNPKAEKKAKGNKGVKRTENPKAEKKAKGNKGVKRTENPKAEKKAKGNKKSVESSIAETQASTQIKNKMSKMTKSSGDSSMDGKENNKPKSAKKPKSREKPTKKVSKQDKIEGISDGTKTTNVEKPKKPKKKSNPKPKEKPYSEKREISEKQSDQETVGVSATPEETVSKGAQVSATPEETVSKGAQVSETKSVLETGSKLQSHQEIDCDQEPVSKEESDRMRCCLELMYGSSDPYDKKLTFVEKTMPTSSSASFPTNRPRRGRDIRPEQNKRPNLKDRVEFAHLQNLNITKTSSKQSGIKSEHKSSVLGSDTSKTLVSESGGSFGSRSSETLQKKGVFAKGINLGVLSFSYVPCGLSLPLVSARLRAKTKLVLRLKAFTSSLFPIVFALKLINTLIYSASKSWKSYRNPFDLTYGKLFHTFSRHNCLFSSNWSSKSHSRFTVIKSPFVFKKSREQFSLLEKTCFVVLPMTKPQQQYFLQLLILTKFPVELSVISQA